MSTKREQMDAARMKLDDAVWLGQLAQWIERAKYLCEHLADSASINEELKAALNAHSIAYNNASWDEAHSDALVVLLGIQRELMTEAAMALEVSHV